MVHFKKKKTKKREKKTQQWQSLALKILDSKTENHMPKTRRELVK